MKSRLRQGPEVGTLGLYGSGPDERRRPWEGSAVRMYLEGRTNMMSGQTACQKRPGETGVKGDSMTLDWPTQKNGLSRVEPGVLKMERVLWPEAHLGFVRSADAGGEC